MWWTESGDTFRGSFVCRQGNGAIATGIAASCTVTVVAPDSTTTTSPAVAESAGKNGSYYFDIPTAFFIANGVGEYWVVVEVNSAAPRVRDVQHEVLRISEYDLDEIATAVAGLRSWSEL